MLASYFNLIEVVKVLMKVKADPFIKDRYVRLIPNYDIEI